MHLAIYDAVESIERRYAPYYTLAPGAIAIGKWQPTPSLLGGGAAALACAGAYPLGGHCTAIRDAQRFIGRGRILIPSGALHAVIPEAKADAHQDSAASRHDFQARDALLYSSSISVFVRR